MYGSVVRYHRKDAVRELARCFPESTPEERKRWLKRMYRNLGLNVVESFRSTEWSEDYAKKHIRIEGHEHIEKTVAEGHGTIFLSGHIGNWELMAFICPHLPTQAHIVVKDLKPPELNDLVVSTREKIGVRVISRKNSLRNCLKVLRNNEILAFMMDQNVIRREGHFVDFFGKEACTTPGVAQLSAKTKSPIIPVIMWRESDTDHCIRVFPPIAPTSGNDEEAIVAKMAECNAFLEGIIREDPSQWTWVHRRWKTRPIAELKAAGIPIRPGGE